MAAVAGAVQGDEVAQRGEVFGGVGGRDRRGRDVEVTTHRLGDLAEGDALVAHRVQDRAGGGGLDGQPGQAGGVGAVHSRPAVGAVTHVAGHAPLAGDADEGGHEPVVAVAMDGRREAQHRRADADAPQATG